MKCWLPLILLLVAVSAFGYAPAPDTYDIIGQLLSADAYEPNSTLRLNENLDYSYDASHNLATRTANMLVQAFTSDALNQLSSIVRSGTLTVSGSITGAVATLGVNGKPAQIYSDGTFATTEGLTLRDGNNMFVTTGSNASGALVLSTISSNRLPVTVSFGYDLNGNLTSDGQRALEYDDANQLTAVTVPGLYRTEFVYDGLSRRRIVRDHTWASGSWQAAGETRYVCDGYLPVQERDANGNVLVTYTRGLDLSGTFGGAGGIGGLLARTDSSGSAFYHADIVGNITSLTDGNGNAVARYLQDPFGRPLGMSGPLAGPNVMRAFSMPYYERADMVGYPFRFYGLGPHRWLNQDPIGEAGGMNLHGFVGNNPINNIDPLGLTWWSGIRDGLIGVGVGVGVGAVVVATLPVDVAVGIAIGAAAVGGYMIGDNAYEFISGEEAYTGRLLTQDEWETRGGHAIVDAASLGVAKCKWFNRGAKDDLRRLGWAKDMDLITTSATTLGKVGSLPPGQRGLGVFDIDPTQYGNTWKSGASPALRFSWPFGVTGSESPVGQLIHDNYYPDMW